MQDKGASDSQRAACWHMQAPSRRHIAVCSAENNPTLRPRQARFNAPRAHYHRERAKPGRHPAGRSPDSVAGSCTEIKPLCSHWSGLSVGETKIRSRASA